MVDQGVTPTLPKYQHAVPTLRVLAGSAAQVGQENEASPVKGLLFFQSAWVSRERIKLQLVCYQLSRYLPEGMSVRPVKRVRGGTTGTNHRSQIWNNPAHSLRTPKNVNSATARKHSNSHLPVGTVPLS